MQKTVMIFVKSVKYYQEQASLVIVGVEVETQRPITQQITVKAFLQGSGRFSESEIHIITSDPERCKLLASQLNSRKGPFKLLFEDTTTEEKGI